MKKHLFLIGGASGSGKTTICKSLAGKINGVICLDGDNLWNCGVFNMENTVQFYEAWFHLANDISENNAAVALFHAGLGMPENATEYAKNNFELHYLSLYCEDDELEKRLSERPEWHNAGDMPLGFINSMKGMNKMYQNLQIGVRVNTTGLPLEQTAKQVKEWIEQYAVLFAVGKL